MSTDTHKSNPTDQATFQNDNISVAVTRHPGCQVKFEITVTPQAAKAGRHEAAKRVNKEVSIPGFRKGKAPADMIEKNFAKAIDSEWKDVVLNTAFKEALKLTGINPFKQESVSKATINNLSSENGATAVIEFEEFPRIPEIDFNELKVPHLTVPEVTQKHIDDALEHLRMEKATWNEITDRPSQEGDFIEIDVDIISDPARNVYERAKFQIAKGKMEEWMRRLLIGKKAGDIVEGMSEKPSKEECKECESHNHEHHHDEEEFTPVNCRITVHAISQPTLPVLDDELAKTYGATGLEDVKDKVTKTLHQRAQERYKNTMRSNMQIALLNKYIFDLPLSLIKQELSSHRREILDDLRRSGTEESEIPAKLKEVEANLIAQLDREMRLFLITQNFTHKHKLSVSDNEAMMEWLQQNWMQKMGQGGMNLPQDPKAAIENIKGTLLVIKMLDYLLEKAGA